MDKQKEFERSGESRVGDELNTLKPVSGLPQDKGLYVTTTYDDFIERWFSNKEEIEKSTK